MNIIVTNTDPILAAQDLDDSRIKNTPKIYVELLGIYIFHAFGHWVLPRFPLWNSPNTNRIGHMIYDHPTAEWVKSDVSNAIWLQNHAFAVINEYKYRFGKEHELIALLKHISTLLPFIYTKNALLPTSFRNGSNHKELTDVVLAYRLTMVEKWFWTDKKRPAQFTKRGYPEWLANYPKELTQPPSNKMPYFDPNIVHLPQPVHLTLN